MILFLVWICSAALILGIYIFLLWKRNRDRSLFRIKLTVLFLLFVLLPTVPLTFLIVNLLTKSADVLLMPEIGSTLETALETIRSQTEERGIAFLENNPNPDYWTFSLLEDNEIHHLGYYRVIGDSVAVLRIFRLPESFLPQNWHPRQESLLDALSTSRRSSLISVEEKRVITVYRVLPDSGVAVATYPVAARVLKARDEIVEALGIYNTLLLLKTSIIQKNLLWSLAVLCIAGLAFLSVFISGKLSRGISEPVQSLVKGMQKVASGDLTCRVETKAKDEFRFLVNSFNTMTTDLRTSRQKLIQAERLAAWQEVARQISHEIKNSLTPIALSLHRLQKHFHKKALPRPIAESLKAVEEELHSLESMASEFSDFARMPQPQKAPLDLNEIVRSSVRLTEPTAGQVKIETTLSPDLPSIPADREQMKRLLNNLIKNAVEASHNTGTVTITTRRSESPGHNITLEIQDHGEGMDKETLEKIFHPYFTTKKKGTGLGLTIVQKIVEDHDGNIQINSKKGKGTQITILL